MGQLLSINVGLPRDVAWKGEKVHTAIWKQPVQGRIAVRRLNVEGDGQGDLAGHGGEHRAVMVYQMDAYRYWEAQLGRNDFSFGQFGENFTVDGLPDDEVCIGDRYRIGSALFEVTQPRVTCYRVGIRMAEPAMAALLVSHHRPGFYFRVLEEGDVGAGDEITKVADGPEHITVARHRCPAVFAKPLARTTGTLAASAGAQPGMENVFKGNCRAEDFGGRESRAQGLKRSATSLARLSAITRRQSGSRSCQCGLVVHRTSGRGISACSSTRTVSRFTVAHNTERPNAAPELLDVRHARRQNLSGKRQTRDERSCQLVSLRSRTRGRYFGGERASGRFYSEIRRCTGRLAECRHRGNARTRHVALAVLRGVTS